MNIKLHIALAVTVATMILQAIVAAEGQCRNLMFKEIANDKALANHAIRTIRPITDFDECTAKCYLDLRCFSINLCTKSDGSMVCNLLDTDHVRSKDDLVDKQGCTYYSSETSCSNSPCPKNATCQGDFVNGPVYRCVCPAGYTGQACNISTTIDKCAVGAHDCHVNAACTNTKDGYKCTCNKGYQGDGKNCQAPANCEELSNILSESEKMATVLHLLQPRGVVGYSELCSFNSSFNCGLGTWKLAMKIDGSLKTFMYNSTLWTDKTTYNPDASITGLDNSETKTSAFWDTPLNKLCLGMKYKGVTRWVAIDVTAGSLYDVMTGDEKATDLGETTWKSLLPTRLVSLQTSCGREGFNLDGGSSHKAYRKLRLGHITSDDSLCRSYRAFIGLGAITGADRPITNCGNFALDGSDKGKRNTLAFCYILVQKNRFPS